MKDETSATRRRTEESQYDLDQKTMSPGYWYVIIEDSRCKTLALSLESRDTFEKTVLVQACVPRAML